MEFEDEHDEEEHEEEEEDDEEDEITIPPPAVPPSYVDSVMGGVNSAPHRVSPVNHSPSTTETVSRRSSAAVRYRECLKNHAVGIGGHAVDGCGEFMPAGEEGTLDALKCAACNCHRNFHRKEVAAATDGVGEGGIRITVPPPPPPTVAVYSGYYRSGSTPNTPSGYLHMSPHIRPHVPALPSSNTSGGTHSGDVEMCDDMSHPSSSGGGGRDSAGMIMMSQKKRPRTKFTQEQKDKMLAFAEKLGWRIQKHDEAAVQHFCGEAQIKRQVLKVWMHNNKHTLGKKP